MTIFQFLVIARWVQFVSVSALFGSALFWLYAGGGAAPGPARLPRAFAATLRLLRLAALAAALSGLAWLAGIVVNMTSSSPAPEWASLRDFEVWRLFFFETNFGAVSGLRLVLLAAALGVVTLRRPQRGFLVALAAIGAALLVSQAWLGHAAQGDGGLRGGAMIVAYSAHVLAAGAWVGGLAPLLFALAEERGEDPGSGSLKILDRFSTMGFLAVVLIVLAGLANLCFRVGASFGRLLDTPYGETLFAKLALVALMLALAAFNRFVGAARLRRASSQSPSEAARLRTSVGVELALGIAVLGAAAALGVTPPPQ